jgi:mannose-1-phosphate guanylyltransferase
MDSFSALLLCAGLGNRLRPLTDIVPKPLVPLLDIPMARHAFEALRRAGATSVFVNAHHLGDQVAAALPEWAADGAGSHVTTRVIIEPELLGTAGGIRNLWDAAGAPQQTLVIHNGDVVLNAPIEALLAHHRATGALATLLTIPAIPGEGEVWVDASRNVAQLPGHRQPFRGPDATPVSRVSFAGVMVLEPRLVERLSPTPSCIIRDGLGPAIAAGERVASMEHSGFWADVGTPMRLLQATWELLEHPDPWPLPVSRPDGLWLREGERAGQGTSVIDGPAYVSSSAELGEAIRVGPLAVIGAGARVLDGSRVRECILMDGSTTEGDVQRRISLQRQVMRTG